LVIFDIDGLRQDAFLRGLESGRLPNLGRLFGLGSVHLNPVSPFPSITFCAQTTIFTGLHPGRHGITGNQFLDRFAPRFYAFDAGETMEYGDAVSVFAGDPGLVNEALDSSVPTLYQRAAREGWTSLVAHHMVSRGADEWLRPSILEIARLTRGGKLFGISSEEYDDRMVEDIIEQLQDGSRPDVLTAYFLGIDHESHTSGPEVQLEHLSAVTDGQVGRILNALDEHGMLDNALVAVVSDHGQIDVPASDRHALELGFPFDRELARVFDALGLDVHDLPGEGEDCNAALGLNGGMAHVYLRCKTGEWDDEPRFDDDVLPVAQAFWEANQSGEHFSNLQNALAMILVRDVQGDGWQADYQVYTPEGLVDVDDYLAAHPELEFVDAVPRLEGLAGPNSGDVLLVANYARGYYFGAPLEGVHGGLQADDSLAVTSLAWVGAGEEELERLESVVESVVTERCEEEGRTRASLADFVPVVEALLGWE
jgi:hypothetical protein